MNEDYYDDCYNDYYDDDYPCDNCGWKDECDGWEALVCPTMKANYGIDDYDPWDV